MAIAADKLIAKMRDDIQDLKRILRADLSDHAPTPMQSFIRLTDKPTGDQIFLLATEIISVLQVSENDKLPRHTRILMRTGANYIAEEDAETVIDYINETLCG